MKKSLLILFLTVFGVISSEIIASDPGVAEVNPVLLTQRVRRERVVLAVEGLTGNQENSDQNHTAEDKPCSGVSECTRRQCTEKYLDGLPW